ncbi:MAG TPA: ABC transporter substrate-binding protein [Trebonia sp.]|jgi:peptide/nickel transport system substrate-binding protein|nr:ABC transporter substrate-binding protein [Trebonia sp.]
MVNRRSTGLAAIALASLVLAAGCSSSGSSSGNGPGDGGAAAPAGMLTIGSSAAPPSLDPTSNAAAAIDEVFDYNVYQHLVQLAPNGQIVPVLATGYAWSADRKTITFTLRPGVKFSNGDPLTAQDVVFSLNRVIAKGSKYPYASDMGTLTSVTAPTATTVAVTLSAPDQEWLYQLAAYSNGVVLDAKAAGSIATAPVGTGPYAYKSQVSNYSVTLAANPHYWGTTPGYGTVVFRYFTNPQAENSALTSGQIQVIDNLSNPADAGQFQSSPSFQIVHGPTDGKIQLTLNNASGPLKNVLVRQAIAYAIDKQSILKTVGGGFGTVIGSDTVPGDPWYSASYARTYAYNPAKAKQLLAQAGYPNGFSLTLTLPQPYAYATQSGPLVDAYLKAVGIRVTDKVVAWPLWLSQVFTAKNFDMTIIDHVEARDVANYATSSYYWNYAKTAQVSALLNAGNAAASQSGQVAKYAQALQMITGDAVNAWLYNPDSITVAKAGIKGLPTSGHTESYNLAYVTAGSVPAAATAQGFSG